MELSLGTIGQIIGYVAIAESFLIYISKTRRKMVMLKLIDDILWLVSYLLTGAYTGAILCAVGVGREIVFYNRDRSRVCASMLWLPFFIAVTLISPAASMISGAEDAHALLPAIGSVLAVIQFYESSPVVMRRLGFPAQTLWLLYTIYHHNTAGIVGNVILLLSAVVGEVRMQYDAHRAKKAQAEEEKEEDADETQHIGQA